MTTGPQVLDPPMVLKTDLVLLPQASNFRFKDWTVGVGAINERSKFGPKKFTRRSVLTYAP